MHTTARRFGVLIAVVLLGAVGCESDDGGGGGGAPPTPTSPVATPTMAVPAAGAGVIGTIDAAAIASDPAGQVTVDFTLTDADGVPLTPLTRGGGRTDQEARVRFTIAHVEEYSGGGDLNTTFTRYVNDIDLTSPGYDSGGMLTTLDGATGRYRYTLATAVPNGVGSSETYSVGMQVDRNFEGEQLFANPVFDFVPAGGDPVIRAASTTAQCNSCHDPLQLHGNRREFRLCTLCHTEAGMDDLGRSIDLRVMIHKIHAAAELPSVVDGPPGTTYAIFSGFQQADVVFSEKEEDGSVTGIHFPRPLNDCLTCHADGPTAAHYMDSPSAAACASCHDDVNPSMEETDAGPPGTNHFNSRGFADGDCTFCHTAEGVEFDISVTGAHTIPERSTQLAGLVVEIDALSSHEAGQTPMVRFRVTDSAGTPLTDLSGLNRLAFTLGGPTDDYAEFLSAVAAGGGSSGTLVGPDGEGYFDYTLPVSLPAEAEGTWVIGAEARRSVQLEVPEGDPISVNEAAVNTVVTFSVDGSMPMARRMVAGDAECQTCHGEFSKGFNIHGSLRNRLEYCAICHNPNESDYARRMRDAEAVAAGDMNATIDFKVLIHKIHTGEELAQHPYEVYGFGPPPAGFSVHDFSHVLYPGDRRNCSACHVEDSYLMPPFPGDALPTLLTAIDPNDGSEVEVGHLGPITATCTSCHDSDAAMAHAATQTDGAGREACLVCHQEGRDVPVSEAHARAGE